LNKEHGSLSPASHHKLEKEMVDPLYTKPSKWRIIYERTGKVAIFRGARHLNIKLSEIKKSKLRFLDAQKTKLNVKNTTNHLILTYINKRTTKKTSLKSNLDPGQSRSIEKKSLSNSQKKLEPSGLHNKPIVNSKNHFSSDRMPKSSSNITVVEKTDVKQDKQERNTSSVSTNSFRHNSDDKSKFIKRALSPEQNSLSSEMTFLEKKLFSSKTTFSSTDSTTLKKKTTSLVGSSTQRTSCEVDSKNKTIIQTSEKKTAETSKLHHERSKLEMIMDMRRKEKSCMINQDQLKKKDNATKDQNNSTCSNDSSVNIKQKNFWEPDSDTEFGHLEKWRLFIKKSPTENKPEVAEQVEDLNEDVVIVSRAHFPNTLPTEFSKQYYDLNMKSFNNQLENMLTYNGIKIETCTLIKTNFNLTGKSPITKINSHESKKIESNSRRRGQENRNHFIHYITTNNCATKLYVDELKNFINDTETTQGLSKQTKKIEIFSGGFLGIRYQQSSSNLLTKKNITHFLKEF
jgi:hypothetical protein